MKKAIVAVLVGMLASCGGSNLSLSMRAGSTASTVAGSPQALTAGTGINLTRVRVVIRKLELQKSGTSEMDDVATGPYLLDLQGPALEGGVNQVLAASFTPGNARIRIPVRVRCPFSRPRATSSRIRRRRLRTSISRSTVTPTRGS